MTSLRLSLAAATLLAVSGSATGQTPKAAEIKPVLPRSQYQNAQPIGGQVRLVGPVQLGKPVKVVADLVCHRATTDTMEFRLVRAEVYAMRFAPDSILWPAPIDSGAARSLEFTFTPTLVGMHRIGLVRRAPTGWQQIAGLAIAFDEDGQLLCAGPSDDCRQTQITPHPLRSERPLTLSFPRNEMITKVRQDRHFTANFRFTPAAQLRDSTHVDFDLECHAPLYQKVQFIVEHSSNIALSPLPASWGDWAGPAPDYRHFKGKFAFVALKPGLTYLNFRIVGKYPFARIGDRVTTEYPMYFVIGDGGEILWAGGYDPYTRFKDATDPMLGSLARLLDVTSRDFRTRYMLSLPDYQGEENKLRDSLGAIAPAVDSAQKK